MDEEALTINQKTGEIVEVKKGFTDEQVALIKRNLCPGATDDELALFIHVANKSGLDPFSKQIYAIRYAGRLTFQTSIDGYRIIAERSKSYCPGRAATYEYDAEKKLISATSYLNKCVEGKWFEVSATAFYDEYINNVNSLWKKMPRVMLAKCAEALALRRAFPAETGNIYTQEEMDQANENRPSIKAPRAKSANGPPDQEHGNGELPPAAKGIDPIEFSDPPFEELPFPKDGKKATPITEKQYGLLRFKFGEAVIPEKIWKAYIQEHWKTEHLKELPWTAITPLLNWASRYAELNKSRD